MATAKGMSNRNRDRSVAFLISEKSLGASDEMADVRGS